MKGRERVLRSRRSFFARVGFAKACSEGAGRFVEKGPFLRMELGRFGFCDLFLGSFAT